LLSIHKRLCLLGVMMITLNPCIAWELRPPKRFYIEHIMSKQPLVYEKMATEIVDLTFYWACYYGIDPDLVLAIMEVESTYNYQAKSKAGALGLMQVMYGIWYPKLEEEGFMKEATLQHYVNPATNIRAGCFILHTYQQEIWDHTKEHELLDRYLGVESQRYRTKVTNAYHYFKEAAIFTGG